MRRNKEPRVPDKYSDWNLKVSTPQGLGARPTQSSSGSAGRMASPNLSEIISTRDHSVDDIFVNGASTLSIVVKEQLGFVPHQHISVLTDSKVSVSVSDTLSQQRRQLEPGVAMHDSGEVRMLQMTTVSHITNGCGGFTNGSSSTYSSSG